MEASFGFFSDGNFTANAVSLAAFAEEDDDEGFDGGSLQVEQNHGSAGYIDEQYCRLGEMTQC